MRRGLVCASLLVASVGHAYVDPPFEQDEVLTIPNDPQVTSMAWAPDNSGRLFVTGKSGHIWIIKDRTLAGATAYKFDPDTELVTASECGLLGLAFDPAFSTNGFIYVFATVNVPPTSTNVEQQIIRFTMNGDVATERVTLIAGLPSRAQNHDGGALAFGPDGLLYWGVGNNGSGIGQGDDLASPGSKIGRASPVLGAPPPPGPFNDGDGPNWDYTFARSVRNPYTMAFDPISGLPWVNIVGDMWEQIFALHAGDHVGYPAENVEPGTSGATVSPIVAYPSGMATETFIDTGGAVRANNVVTITTTVPHALRKGGMVTILGIDENSFNGDFTITSVPTLWTFTYAQSGADATSGVGAAKVADYGSVVLGGAFYNGTRFPAEYRNNFFFGDFGTGQLVRVETGTDGSVARVSRFGLNVGNHIDSSIGPDGALWIVNYNGNVRRITYTATQQNIIVAPQNLRIAEGDRGYVAVSLAMAPAADVNVTLARSGGSAFIEVANPSLTFTPANWNQPQFIEVSSSLDADLVEDTTTFDATAFGIPTETVTVRATDMLEPLPVSDDVPSTDGPVATASGCCGVGGSSNGVLAVCVMLYCTSRRRRPARRSGGTLGACAYPSR